MCGEGGETGSDRNVKGRWTVSLLPNDGRMKPILIIPDGTMKPEDIKRLNDNGICTVEAKNPALVKFLDPIPSAAERTRVEDAAIALSRKMLRKSTYADNGGGYDYKPSRGQVCEWYIQALVKGTPLDSDMTQEERDQQTLDQAKQEELRRLAREEARAERAAKKAAEKEKAEATETKGGKS
jgi:hypothetical protein